MTKDDIEDYTPPVDNFDDTDDDDDDSITITIGKKKKKKKPQMPIVPEPEKEKSGYSFSSTEKYKKEIAGEKARQEAIAKARAKYKPLEDELQAEREKTEMAMTGEYVPKKKGFCDKHPKLCKAVGKGKTKSIPAPDVSDVEISQNKSKRQLAKEQKEQERLDRIEKGTDTYCDRHPKLCKVGKVAGGVALTGAIIGAAAVDPVEVGTGLGMATSHRKKTVKGSQKSKSASKTVAGKRRSASSGSRTTASKTKTTVKRTASTSKGRTTSQNARKPTQKRTTASKARKSTPKKKSPRKPKGSDWWGYGDAGL